MRRSLAVSSFLVLIACSSEGKKEDADPIPDAGEVAVEVDGGAADPLATDAPDAGATTETRVVFEAARITSQSSEPNFQRVRATVDFGPGPFTSAKLIVNLTTTCFPFEQWQRNPAPPGQFWPADCDAFDRNFEISLDPPRTSTGAPALELVRAITPFGGPLNLEADVTDVANGLPGRHTVEVYIATWSDANGRVTGSNGGWNVSLSFELTRGAAPRRVLAVIPLANLESGSGTATRAFAFTTPEGATDARIEYRVTGHGSGAPGQGCVGPAEEFCRRRHRLFVDGHPSTSFEPWREDCGDLCTLAHLSLPLSAGRDYCAENPCGDVRSVRAPRANWCPGSQTPPFVVEDPALLAPGRHSFSYMIDRVNAGGIWRISATYFATQTP